MSVYSVYRRIIRSHSFSKFSLFKQLKIQQDPHILNWAKNTTVNEDQKHSLGDKKVLDCVAHVAEGRSIFIKQLMALCTALSVGREAEDACDDYAGKVSAAADAMT